MADTRCGLCGRVLSQEDDPLSGDCGGDCWGCIGQIEAEMGWQQSIDFFNREVDRGLRPGPKIAYTAPKTSTPETGD